MDEEKERRPEECRADGEDVSDVAGRCVLVRVNAAIGGGVELREAEIGAPPVFLEAQIVLNQGRPRVRIVTDAIAVNDGIDKRERGEENEQQNARACEAKKQAAWARRSGDGRAQRAHR